jgi:two-component system heavy metal sensor histidine kinase CusS
MITLRRRILITLMAVVAFVVFLSLTVVVLLVRRDELLALDRVILTEARVLAHDLDQGARPEDALSPANLDAVEIPEEGETDAVVALYDERGKLLAPERPPTRTVEELLRNARLARPGALPASFDLEMDGEAVRGVVLPITRGRYLFYAASRAAVDEDLFFLLRVLPVVFVLALSLAALVAHWLGGVLARDVVRIGAVARAVTDGNLAARVGTEAIGAEETFQLARDLDEMIDRLAALLEAQRRFATDAAHELRSPIATLRGQIQLALRRERSVEGYREILTELLSDVEALTRLAEDLLALSRSDDAASSGEHVSANELVEDAMWMARGLLNECGASCEVHERSEGAGLVRVRGSRGELARVVRNLLDNAIRYGARGGPIRIELSADAALVHVAVVDHGPGVSPGERDAIFAAFHRGEQGLSAGQGGAGLGLFIAREIARAHHGDVMLDAQAHDGARFVLELPRPAEAA